MEHGYDWVVCLQRTLSLLSFFECVTLLSCISLIRTSANQTSAERKRTPSPGDRHHANPLLSSPARIRAMNLPLAPPPLQLQTPTRPKSTTKQQTEIWVRTYRQPVRERKGRAGTASRQNDWRRGTSGLRRGSPSMRWAAGGSPWS